MKKGFTLVELLAVIVVLAIILVIAIPNVMKVIEKTKIDVYIKNEKMMVSAAKKYLVSNSTIVPIKNNDTVVINLSDLKNNNILDEIIDPISNSECEGYVLVRKVSTNDYDYKSYIKCGTNYTSKSYIINGLVLDMPLGDKTLSDGSYEDFSGYNNNGTNYGTTFAANRFGEANKASYFNGVDAYISIRTSDSLNILNTITIGAWVKTNDITKYQHVVARGPAYYTTALYKGKMYIKLTLDDLKHSILSISELQNNIWYFLVWTYDGEYIRYYINGNLDSEANTNHGKLMDIAQSVTIGKEPVGYFFDGFIDDVKIYDRTLSADEIKHIYTLEQSYCK